MGVDLLGLAPSELQEKIAADRRGLPYLALRNGQARLLLHPLTEGATTIGRAPGVAVLVDWDPGVSRIHAIVEGLGGAWFVVDDGLSTNGTHLQGTRVQGRRRLVDGDVIRIGDTHLRFCDPGLAGGSDTLPVVHASDGIVITPAQRRVLVALCRPTVGRDDGLAVAAANREIAAELSISVEAVRSHLKVLFVVFAIADLPQHRKRAELVSRALGSGVVRPDDLKET